MILKYIIQYIYIYRASTCFSKQKIDVLIGFLFVAIGTDPREVASHARHDEGDKMVKGNDRRFGQKSWYKWFQMTQTINSSKS